jgi:hypothetical protein
MKRVQGAEDSGMTKALCNPAGVERIELIGLQMKMNVTHE